MSGLWSLAILSLRFVIVHILTSGQTCVSILNCQLNWREADAPPDVRRQICLPCWRLACSFDKHPSILQPGKSGIL